MRKLISTKKDYKDKNHKKAISINLLKVLARKTKIIYLELLVNLYHLMNIFQDSLAMKIKIKDKVK